MSAIVERQWSDVRPGDFVVDKAGKTWKVEGRDPLGAVHLVDQRGGRINIGRMSGPVGFWDLSPEAENLEAFRVALGATILYDRH